MVVISGLSAWEYWRTPPQLRDAWMDPALLQAWHPNDPQTALLTEPLRANAREEERLVKNRLLSDLKGISTPVDIISNSTARRPSRLIHARRRPVWLEKEDVCDLGNNLYILSPAATMIDLCKRLDTLALAKLMFEACGIFTIPPQNSRIELTINDLCTRGAISAQLSKREGLAAYLDEKGRPCCDYTPDGVEERSWQPVFTRSGTMSDMWKRPPLCTPDQLRESVRSHANARSIAKAAQAYSAILPGAASPAEVFAILLLCADPSMGGEGWDRPRLNQRIALSKEAANLAHQHSCVADAYWPANKSILEVHGETFHADELGFRLDYGRSAGLESMGFTVAEITYEQLASLERLDTMLPALAKKLGFEPHPKNPSFLKRRSDLHEALFGTPYEPIGV